MTQLQAEVHIRQTRHTEWNTHTKGECHIAERLVVQHHIVLAPTHTCAVSEAVEGVAHIARVGGVLTTHTHGVGVAEREICRNIFAIARAPIGKLIVCTEAILGSVIEDTHSIHCRHREGRFVVLAHGILPRQEQAIDGHRADNIAIQPTAQLIGSANGQHPLFARKWCPLQAKATVEAVNPLQLRTAHRVETTATRDDRRLSREVALDTAVQIEQVGTQREPLEEFVAHARLELGNIARARVGVEHLTDARQHIFARIVVVHIVAHRAQRHNAHRRTQALRQGERH